MSAIAGLVHFDGRPGIEERLQAMMAPLAHRGGGLRGQAGSGNAGNVSGVATKFTTTRGIWQDDHAALGHHLYVLTPEDRFEQQPLRDPESGLVMTVACRLDNRDELFSALGIAHDARAFMPDGELIFKAWLRWGMDCPGYLRGDFSIAVWDERERRLVLVCDPVGRMPLWLHRRGALFAFASQPRALFTLPRLQRRVDERACGWYLSRCMGGLSSPTSWFKGIERLPGGHTLVVDAQGKRLHRYWRPEDLPSLHGRSDEDLLEQFRAVFFDAVASRLRGVQPAAVLLSGGLDSGAVASIAAQILAQRGEELIALSYRPLPDFDGPLPRGRVADESRYIEAVVSQYENIRLISDHADGQHLLSQADRLLSATESPPNLRDDWMAVLMKEAQSQSVGTLLNGQMGNISVSWPGGNPFPGMFRQGHWRDVWRGLRQHQQYGDASMPSLIKNQLLVPLLPDALVAGRQLWSWHRGKRGKAHFLNDEFVAAASEQLRCRYQALVEWRDTDGDANQLKVWLKRHRLPAVGNATAKARAYGLSWQDPTADQRLVEFCLAAPERIYRHQGRTRTLLRRGLQGVVPAEVLWREDRGLQSCDAGLRVRMAQGELLELLQRFEASSQITGMLHMANLHQTFRQCVEGKAPGHKRIWGFWKAMLLGKFLLWCEQVEPFEGS